MCAWSVARRCPPASFVQPPPTPPPPPLPYYEGYEWRRSGPDVVLIAVGTGIVYEILEGVLN